MRYSSTTCVISSLTWLGFLTGCQSPVMCVSDAFMMSGMKTNLDARLESRGKDGRMAGIPGARVKFFMHDQPLGEAITDGTGVAKLMCDLPGDSTHYRAEVKVGDSLLVKEGLVFGFPRGRTLLVCDIDETISMTHYRELVFDEDDMASTAFQDAAATLTKLNGRFGLVYLTARPAFLLEKTKRWIEKNGFPRAPVITTPSLFQSIGVQRFKAERIAHLMNVLGVVGIGIGNATTDAEAFAMQHLLPVVITDYDDHRFRAHAVIMRNWKMIDAFFEANRKILEDPAKLQAAIDGEQMLLRPLIRYQPRR